MQATNIIQRSKGLLGNGLAWKIAIATAVGAYGGFPKAPAWWEYISQFKIVQFLLLWVLVYSSALPAGRNGAPWCGGTQTSCYGAAGSTGSTTNTTVEYDGTSWSGGGNVPASRSSGPGNGVGKPSAGLVFEGYYDGNYKNETYEYDGTSWSTSNNSIYNRGQLSGAGTQGAAVSAGGWFSPAKQWSSETAEYNGTCWSAANLLVTATYAVGGGGSISAAFITGGEKGSNVYANETQEYTRAVMKFIGT